MSAGSRLGEGSLTIKEEIKEDDTISITSEISKMSSKPITHSTYQSLNLDI